MDRDQRPANPMQDLRDLQRDVAQALGPGGREALTKASKGWILPPMDAPDPPEEGVHLFTGMDSSPYVIDSSGTITRLTGQVAPNVTGLTATTGTAGAIIDDVGATYNRTTLNNNFRSLTEKVNAILAALKASDQMEH